jgi:hypothetical protein
MATPPLHWHNFNDSRLLYSLYSGLEEYVIEKTTRI